MDQQLLEEEFLNRKLKGYVKSWENEKCELWDKIREMEKELKRQGQEIKMLLEFV